MDGTRTNTLNMMVIIDGTEQCDVVSKMEFCDVQQTLLKNSNGQGAAEKGLHI